MFIEDMNSISTAAANKAEVSSKHPGIFFWRAIMAGFFIVVAILLSNVTAAVLYSRYPEWAKVIGAFLFSIAIVLIVFIGGELFTGNNMTLALGVYNKKCRVSDMLRVWVYSYIGNFIGAALLSVLFVYSGAAKNIMTNYYMAIIPGKLDMTWYELLLRGILCNFLVCLAVWTGTRMKTESGKLIVMFCVIMAFVISGFEHCIANMGTFTIAALLCPGMMTGAAVAKSMILVTIGNIIGGAVLLALPLKLMSYDK